MNQTFQRARSPEHKEARRTAILEAASVVLERDGFHETSLNAIAQEAGVVKSGLYRYFESREEILLELALTDVTEVVTSLRESITGPMSVDELAAHMAQGFLSRPRLCLLISRMSTVLEHNITADTLRGVKRRLNDCSQVAGEALCVARPDWTPQEAYSGVMMLHTHVSGVYPMAHPPAHLAEVMSEPEFEATSPRFEDIVPRAALAIFRGIDSMVQDRLAAQG
ncbi:TetR/AcrR family transcriptional regulator [Pontivivens insulae]|nr:TetR family transcriptional regulator [Pontivivens insulae]